jgi:prepilin-type N-terminal cleavage/methylation domain-containing protein
VTRLRAALGDESGVTLIEVLIASMIFSIAGLAIVGGFLTSFLVADLGAKQAGVEAALRSAAEEAKAAPYVGCATTYAVTAPPDFDAAVTEVAHYRATEADLTVPAPGDCSDTDTQVLTVTVGSTDGKIDAATHVVKRPDHAP